MPTIHIVYGQQGAGKTSYAQQLADLEQGIRFSIDEWMAELFGPDLPQPLDFAWIMERVTRCEARIWQTAVTAAAKGNNIILDLGFMKTHDRAKYVALAHDQKLTVQRHFITAPQELRRQRVQSRNTSKNETFSFEVSPQMFDFMEAQFEAPNSDELRQSILHNSQ